MQREGGKRRERKLELQEIKKKMATEAAMSTLYNGVAFRLPALQLDANEEPRNSRPTQDCKNACPRETRALAASESALFQRQERQWSQKKAALSRLKRCKADSQCELETHEASIEKQGNDKLSSPIDAMGFLARELTEVKEALESNKGSFKKDSIKGLRKVVAGVLHTLRQDQIKTVFDSMKLSSTLKYENITQAASLSPRILNKPEKREPINRRIHVCKGCKEGGLLPWMYLYPDHEVYRTGGGFDCVEFHLPVVHSEKALTKPKNPFEKPRGKLVDLSMHKLPERKPGHKTKLAPFNFNRKKKSQDQPSQHIETFSNPTAIDRIEFGKRRPRTFPDLKETKATQDDTTQSTGYDEKEYPIFSTLETNTLLKEKESDPFNSTSSSDSTLILGWQRSALSMETDSGVVTAASSASDSNSFESAATIEKNPSQKSLNELSSLHKRVIGYDNLGPFKATKQWTESELPHVPKKLVVRKSMAVTNHVKNDFRSMHNSSLLSKNDDVSKATKNAFGVRMKPLKLIGARKNSNALDISIAKVASRNSSATVSDMSLNFSTSLSLETASQQGTEDSEYSDFTLTGSRVTGMKRISREIKRSPRPKERRTSKGPKRQSEVTPITEDEHETERIYEIERKRKDSKDENGMTEVVVDIASSMISESTTPDAYDVVSSSRTTSCRESRRSKRQEVTDVDVSGNDIDDKMTESSSVDGTNDVSGINMDSETGDFKSDDIYELDEEESDDYDEAEDDLPGVEEQRHGKKRRKLKKRTTLQFRMEPLSKYSVKRRSRESSESGEEMDDYEDLSMLDYAARYCIISLQKLSKYENVFSSFADCGGEAEEHQDEDLNEIFEADSEEQRKILKEYEKLIYSMDVYQQKISEAERKRADLKNEREVSFKRIKSLEIDEAKKKILEKSVQAFSKKITTVDDRIKTFIGNVKSMIERKRQLEEQLRATAMDSKKVDKIIENSDFLGRKFTKLRCLKINVNELPVALRSFNPNLDEEDLQFITHVLKLPQTDSLDFKAFAVVSALAERVKSLDKSIKALLKGVDLGTLERKLDKCKELYLLLSEERHDGKLTVPLENLLVELQAGGLDRDHQRSVINKLNHNGHGFVDFLDFVLYIPLFLMIHDQIVEKPFE